MEVISPEESHHRSWLKKGRQPQDDVYLRNEINFRNKDNFKTFGFGLNEV